MSGGHALRQTEYCGRDIASQIKIGRPRGSCTHTRILPPHDLKSRASAVSPGADKMVRVVGFAPTTLPLSTGRSNCGATRAKNGGDRRDSHPRSLLHREES